MAETKTKALSLKDVESKVVELGKQGETPAKIGLILRDEYGIPRAKLAGKKISTILKANNLSYKADEERVKEKINSLNKHLQKHKKDSTAKRSLGKVIWISHKLKSEK